MTKSKNLFKNISLFLCLVPMLVLSLFCLVPQKQNLDIYAVDEVFTPFSFVGSNYIVPNTTYSTSGSYDGVFLLGTKARFSVSSSGVTVDLYGSYARKDFASIRYINTEATVPFNATTVIDCPIVGVSGYKMQIIVTTSSNVITSNINRVRFYYETDTSNSNWINYVVYYDVSGNFISYGYKTYFGSGSNDLVFGQYTYEDRTYYLNLGVLDDNDYYQAGYQDGYNVGLTDGSSSGYQDGYNAGETIGYGNGYNAGVEHGGNYTFMGLIGAVIDAPVSAFTSLLNFELLGVNILGFITGLLTLALIIFIIKLCMGGK